MKRFEPAMLLAALVEHRVEFVVIGGFAAFVRGAPVVTLDIDIVYACAADNIGRLCAALRQLGATYRHQFGRRIEPREEALAAAAGPGHHLITTRSGDIVVLRRAAGRDFATLVPESDWVEIGGSRVRVASLACVIALKEAAARPKDLLALPTLRAVLELQEIED